MAGIREHDPQVHLGTQVDEVAGAAPLAVPGEAAGAVDLDRREEVDARRDVAPRQAELGGGGEEILGRVAQRSGRAPRRVVAPTSASWPPEVSSMIESATRPMSV